jgi:hypothetical protein
LLQNSGESPPMGVCRPIPVSVAIVADPARRIVFADLWQPDGFGAAVYPVHYWSVSEDGGVKESAASAFALSISLVNSSR